MEIEYLREILIVLAYKACIKGFTFKGEAIYIELCDLYIEYIISSHVRLAVHSPFLKV